MDNLKLNYEEIDAILNLINIEVYSKDKKRLPDKQSLLEKLGYKLSRILKKG